jgi:hypothetical protein
MSWKTNEEMVGQHVGQQTDQWDAYGVVADDNTWGGNICKHST